MSREEKEQIITAIIIFILIGTGLYRFYATNKVNDNVVKENRTKIEVIYLDETEENKAEQNREAGFKPLKLININEASQDELEKLPGIGETFAKRIISYRMTNGIFARKEEIMKVKGIGEKRYGKMKDFIAVR